VSDLFFTEVTYEMVSRFKLQISINISVGGENPWMFFITSLICYHTVVRGKCFAK